MSPRFHPLLQALPTPRGWSASAAAGRLRRKRRRPSCGEKTADGLGPTYNAQSCRECHQNVVTGGSSQIAEHRTGRMDGQVFFESLGGSLIQSRATHSNIVERVAFEDNIGTFRISTNTLGGGFVEAIANSTLLAIRDRQPADMRGTALPVPVLEAGSALRIGRCGWKAQHASLESFAADAYLNEMGITTPTFPEENQSADEYVGFGTQYDRVADPEDDGEDVIAFADFMRATKAPLRGPITTNVRAGEQVFLRVGCAACHVPSITTAPPGTPINGGALRTRNRLMHDGLSSTKEEAIRRHMGQAAPVTAAFNTLTSQDQALHLKFLNSL